MSPRKLRLLADCIEQGPIPEDDRRAWANDLRGFAKIIQWREQEEDAFGTEPYMYSIPNYSDVIPVADFISGVSRGHYSDDDGSGFPARNGKMDRLTRVFPSMVSKIPLDATHIVWFNK